MSLSISLKMKADSENEVNKKEKQLYSSYPVSLLQSYFDLPAMELSLFVRHRVLDGIMRWSMAASKCPFWLLTEFQKWIIAHSWTESEKPVLKSNSGACMAQQRGYSDRFGGTGYRWMLSLPHSKWGCTHNNCQRPLSKLLNWSWPKEFRPKKVWKPRTNYILDFHILNADSGIFTCLCQCCFCHFWHYWVNLCLNISTEMTTETLIPSLPKCIAATPT